MALKQTIASLPTVAEGSSASTGSEPRCPRKFPDWIDTRPKRDLGLPMRRGCMVHRQRQYRSLVQEEATEAELVYIDVPSGPCAGPHG